MLYNIFMIQCTFENGNKATLRHVVADVLVLKEDTILFVKRANELSEGGKWGLIGGYIEQGETVIEGVKREVFEETGYEISDLKLLWVNDNPDRPNEDKGNISFVYYCQAGEQTGKPDWESEEIRWFPLEALPPEEHIAFDHMLSIEKYKQLKERI